MPANAVINKADLANLNSALLKFKQGGEKVIRFSTNDALKGVRTDAVDEIKQKVTCKVTKIRETFKITTMKINNLNAHVESKGKPVPLIHWGAKWLVKGVTVNLIKGSPRDLIKHAFFATMKSGHKGVFWRQERGRDVRPKILIAGKRVKIPSPPERAIDAGATFQLPIRELFGPRIPDIFDDDEIMDVVLTKAGIRFQKRLEHHTNRLIDSAR